MRKTDSGVDEAMPRRRSRVADIGDLRLQESKRQGRAEKEIQ